MQDKCLFAGASFVAVSRVLSGANIAEVQKRLPNRNGMTRLHGLWDLKGKPDVTNTACMHDCTVQLKVVSQLPEYARSVHGDLADQNRSIGPVRGVRTAQTMAAGGTSAQPAASARSLAEKSGCLACHGVMNKVVGPGMREIAAKYQSHAGAESKLATKVKSGGQGVWGQLPMPPQPAVSDEDIRTLVQWILGGAK